MSSPLAGLAYDFTGLVPPKAWDKFYESFEPFLIKALEELRGEITQLVPDGATGNMGRAIVTDILQTGEHTVGKVWIPGTDAASQYAWFVEHGRGPGKMPPWDVGTPLYQWVKRKINNPVWNKSRTSYSLPKKAPQDQT